MRLGIVCGSFHRNEVERMLEYARDEASSKNWEVADVAWVPGSMEAPLALDRMLHREDIDGAVVLGIIERGETDHGLVPILCELHASNSQFHCCGIVIRNGMLESRIYHHTVRRFPAKLCSYRLNSLMRK